MEEMNVQSGHEGHRTSTSMVFTTDHSTPLYSSAWTPRSTGEYAATCIFLVVLAIINRLLQAYRSHLEVKWRTPSPVRRRYVRIAGENDVERERHHELDREHGEKPEEPMLTRDGLRDAGHGEHSASGKRQSPAWSVSTDLPRACIFTIQAGAGYLLMLAVMTLNVGYFLSTLAGLFLGELAVGRFVHTGDSHH